MGELFGGHKKRPQKRPRPWTNKQCQFLAKYLADPDRVAWRAWQAAYPSARPPTCMSMSATFLNREDVQEYLAVRVAPIAKDVELDRDRIVREWAYVGLLDPAEAEDDQGRPLLLKDMPERVRRAISSVEYVTVPMVGEDGEEQLVTKVKKVTYHPKLKALEDAAKHLRMFVEIHELHKSDPLADLSDVELDKLERQLLARQREMEALEEGREMPGPSTIQ